MYQKILLVGAGAREHVILEKIIESVLLNINNHNLDTKNSPIKIYTYNFKILKLPNINTENLNIIKNIINLKGNDTIEAIKNKCIDEKIDLVIASQEKYLVAGLVDILKEVNIACFGPNQAAAMIEGSKEYSKNLMIALGIPTADYKVFIRKQVEECKQYLKNNFDYNKSVIKVSGLAAGKGVFLPKNLNQAIEIIDEIMINKIFGDAGNTIIIEERLYGEEVSVMAFCNGHEAVLMQQAQDYKRIFDGDRGPNTGGMGAICPVSVLSSQEIANIQKDMNKIVNKLDYIGVLYAGIIKTKNLHLYDDSNTNLNPNINHIQNRNHNSYYVLEYNCRFGDPEAQVILNCLDMKYNNLLNIIEACINKQPIKLRWTNKIAANVVLSNEEYPFKKLPKYTEINIPNFTSKSDIVSDPEILLYYANMEEVESKGGTQISYITNGGRILSMVKVADTLFDALNCIYNNIYHIQFTNLSIPSPYYRRDIGQRLLLKRPDRMRKPINIAIMGSTRGTSSEKLMSMTLNNDTTFPGQVKLVISNKKNAEILYKARQHNISYLYLPFKNDSEQDYDKQLVNILRAYNIDMLILVGYMKIISKVLIDEYEDNIINIHPSLLPFYSGMMDMDVHSIVLKNNDKFTGCTLHVVSEEVDAGRILLQSQIRTENYHSPESLKKRVQELESECIVNYIRIAANFKLNYSVNIKKANEFTEILKRENDAIGGFCAIKDCNEGKRRIGLACDGVGTKLDLADKYDKLDNIGIDLVAMCINDLLAQGVRPYYFLDYIAIDKMNVEKCNKIVESVKKGCEIAKCELVGGETAEMMGIYRKNKWDVAGFAVGFIEEPERDQMPKISNFLSKNSDEKSEIVLYGLKSSGIHSNGFTLINKILKSYYIDENKDGVEDYITEILKPTRIYMEILDILKDYGDLLLACAHITGGGFHDNIVRVIPENYSYNLENFEWPWIFHWIQEHSGLNKEEMMQTFNCGIGMILFLKNNRHEKEKLREIIDKYELVYLGDMYKIKK